MTEARFILSRSILLAQYNKLKAFCDKISYSAKTNYEVAKLLEKETDCDFNIHSAEALLTIADPARIWYFPQGWSQPEVKDILGKNFRNFVLDSEPDLDELLLVLKTQDLNINLLLRMRLKENTIHTGKHFVYGLYSDKINQLIPLLRQNKKIGKLGIHFHRKTQNLSEWDLTAELKQILTPSTLKSLDILNIGGGFPVRYKNYTADIEKPIFAEIKKLKAWLKPHNIQLVAEPGRYLAASPIKLISTIKRVYDHNIIIDCSVYNSAMDTFVANTKLEVEGELEEGIGEAYTIKGITPDSMDIFRYRVYLNDPKVGDTIIFLNAGAYNFSTDFCGLKKLKTEIVD
jgi:ornithine decarboxylase